MVVINTIREMQEWSKKQKRNGNTVGVVPTMGFLHEGHLSLIDAAKKNSDKIIVTIFVNPTQFGPNEDLDKYPRDFERDESLCEDRGADAIFYPSVDEMYPANASTWVNEEILSQHLCGASRPEHFRGVTTVVTKLFNATLPDVAVFGQKDAQQALILQRMTRDLNFPIDVIVQPIVREEDGLALSSRNKYLSEQQRTNALSISKSLFAADTAFKSGVLLDEILKTISKAITAAEGKIDYIEARNTETLDSATSEDSSLLIAVAAKFGTTRLIDNIIVSNDKQN